MLDDRLQFAISQYLDGTLPSEERAALEQRLAADPEARQFLEEERRLNAVLQSSAALPAVNWDRLHEHLSAAVTEQEGLAEISRYRIGWVRHVRALAVAAVVLLLLGATVVAYLATQGDIGRPGGGPVAIMDVRVLEPASPAGPAVAEVSIGPSPTLADTGGEYPLHDAGGVVSRPSFVMIATAGQSAQDTTIYAH